VASEARFKEISEAFSVLSDPSQRASTTRCGRWASGARFTAGGGQGGFEDVFGGMFGRQGGGRQSYSQSGFEDLLGGMFGGGGGFGTASGGYRGYGGPTGRRRHGQPHPRLPHRRIGGDTVTLQLQNGHETKVKIRPASRTARRSDSRARVSRAPMEGSR